jgi:peptidoglycan LD-endopeptidase LytH
MTDTDLANPKKPLTRRQLVLALAGCFLLTGLAAVGAVWFLRRSTFGSTLRDQRLISYLANPQEHQDWVVEAGQRCGDAPFLMPTRGYIGYLRGDSFRPFHRHSGLDIFGGTKPGITPVYAAADAYLTRRPDWISTVILRVPTDPLQPGRTIWLYYTHMADPLGEPLIDAAFPPGSSEVFIPAGTLLGYQGNYSGTPGTPTGVHLHFSIVLDDGQGGFRDERKLANTLDPSPYLGMALDARQNKAGFALCSTGAARYELFPTLSN